MPASAIHQAKTLTHSRYPCQDSDRPMASERLKSIPKVARLKDVAAAAGVSVSTASRVLSGAPNTSAEAAAAVRAASKRLQYRPNPIARALRAKTTGLAGMVVPEIGNPFFAELVEATERALREADLELILGDSLGSLEGEAHRIETMVDRQVDGLIVIPTHHRASTETLIRAQESVPVVQLDRQADGFHGDYVGVDNDLGIQLVIDHLAGQGCERIVFVSDAAVSSTGRTRLETFARAIEKAGVHADSPLLGSFSVAFGREAVRQLISERRVPQAIVCGSDIVALGVTREVHKHGIRIPNDVRITGFDGIVFAELCDPPLTTVEQPVASIAAEAVRLLVLRMDGDTSAARRSEIAPRLVVRESSAALKAE
jgi:LacI family transcriptional regulator